MSHEFSHYLLHHGISHQYSCPHTPEKNGIVERKNCHILETARTLLHHASLPHSFWIEATNTAAYLINRLPSKTLQMQSPYQKLYQQPPSLLHLKTFGCLCYLWTAYTCNNKLDPKSSSCIFLGYSSDRKVFRCLDPNTSKLIIFGHVRFHEHVFPMAKPPTTSSSCQISTIYNHLSILPTPTFYPPSTTSTPTTKRPQTPPPPPPTRKTDTHIQYQRRRTHPNNFPTSTLPPLLPLPTSSLSPPHTTQTNNTHPMIPFTSSHHPNQ